MSTPFFRTTLLTCAGLAACLQSVPAAATVDRDGANLVFDEARTICDRDAGALWGRSLCGPILIVDPMDRAAIANQQDPGNALTAGGNVFTGTLPTGAIMANTRVEWSGTRWTQLLWPVSFETTTRRVTLAHEMFHRIQPDLGLTRPEAGNRHLDTLEGRYLLQLEWRALAQALMADDADDRRAHVTDALAFRHARHGLFANAAGDEAALEINEGIAEYTGVRLGLARLDERQAYAIFDLSRFLDAPSFVRSFAYASGPAYGLLLDDADPEWRGKISASANLGALLATAYNTGAAVSADLDARKRRYDVDGSLREAEVRRDGERIARVDAYRVALIEGPLLVLPLAKSNFQFNPQTLVPLDDAGTVYPTLRLTDAWGDLVVERNGALVQADMKRATVPLPRDGGLRGDGWTLTLKPGWKIAPGARAGDSTLVRDDSQP
ncbi:hypothetical protein [Montanilutibacter psychrotolerans]|uniref:hypothetical protein n=1 Tax=Montanilutibacter psychrotolerans TaxID=1327343 RepID=UPI001CC20FCF|nr:hypothetical protein [Lysobacter psychrotolerans]